MEETEGGEVELKEGNIQTERKKVGMEEKGDDGG